jgi:hypothetical protein
MQPALGKPPHIEKGEKEMDVPHLLTLPTLLNHPIKDSLASYPFSVNIPFPSRVPALLQVTLTGELLRGRHP